VRRRDVEFKRREEIYFGTSFVCLEAVSRILPKEKEK